MEIHKQEMEGPASPEAPASPDIEGDARNFVMWPEILPYVDVQKIFTGSFRIIFETE